MGLFSFGKKSSTSGGSCTCKGCGASFDWSEAAAEFNAHFDDEYDYDYNGWDGWCADCAISGMEDRIEEGEEYDEDNPPPGCRECGGPFPLCKDGCPMYDDD